MKFWSLTCFAVLLATSVSGFAQQKALTTSAAEPAALSKAAGDSASPSDSPSDRVAPSPMLEAAAGNRKSSVELRWFFGGKPQRGWSIYVPLILNEVQADDGVESGGFAWAVARWQKARGLRQTGVVNDETWSTMIGEFQSRRINERTYASPDELVLAPAEEFYDNERPAELRQVDRAAYAAYKRLVAEAAKDGSLGLKTALGGGLDSAKKYLKIISAFRSREYQDHLRRMSPHSGRAGLAVNSPHFTGRTLDLYVGGDPVNTSDSNRLIQINTPVYRWLVKNAARFGFKPYFYEPWHWEYGR